MDQQTAPVSLEAPTNAFSTGVPNRDHAIALDLRLRESDHRARNHLAVISAAIRLSASDPTEKAFATRISAFLTALAWARDAVDAQDPDLGQLIGRLTRPYADLGMGKITSNGPDIAISGPIRNLLWMVMHELATNAVKHGALSDHGGRLDIRWDHDGGELTLAWHETGIRSAPARPSGEGMGLQSALLAGIGGCIERHFSAETFLAQIRIPVAPACRQPET